MNIPECLQFVKNQLTPLSGDLALSEAEQIMEEVLKCSRSDLYLSFNALLFKNQQQEIESIVERRKRREPLPYIFNKAYFHSRSFYIDNSVLIPRPETEVLVETILASEKKPYCLFLDLGIGSGAISSILAMEKPLWQGIGSDLSGAALRIAKRNCGGNVLMLNADAFSAFKLVSRFDFIMSNPPYISAAEMDGLDPSVKDFEPRIALFGGDDGLDFYRILAEKGKDILAYKGRLYCEIGPTQGKAVTELLAKEGWQDIRILSDLAERPRVCVCRA